MKARSKLLVLVLVVALAALAVAPAFAVTGTLRASGLSCSSITAKIENGPTFPSNAGLGAVVDYVRAGSQTRVQNFYTLTKWYQSGSTTYFYANTGNFGATNPAYSIRITTLKGYANTSTAGYSAVNLPYVKWIVCN